MALPRRRSSIVLLLLKAVGCAIGDPNRTWRGVEADAEERVVISTECRVCTLWTVYEFVVDQPGPPASPWSMPQSALPALRGDVTQTHDDGPAVPNTYQKLVEMI